MILARLFEGKGPCRHHEAVPVKAGRSWPSLPCVAYPSSTTNSSAVTIVSSSHSSGGGQLISCGGFRSGHSCSCPHTRSSAAVWCHLSVPSSLLVSFLVGLLLVPHCRLHLLQSPFCAAKPRTPQIPNKLKKNSHPWPSHWDQKELESSLKFLPGALEDTSPQLAPRLLASCFVIVSFLSGPPPQWTTPSASHLLLCLRILWPACLVQTSVFFHFFLPLTLFSVEILYTEFFFLHTWSHVAQAVCPWSCYVVEDKLELMIPLPPTPSSWDCRHVPSHPLYVVLGIKPRISCMLGELSPDWATSQAQPDTICLYSVSPALSICPSRALSECSSPFQHLPHYFIYVFNIRNVETLKTAFRILFHCKIKHIHCNHLKTY